MRTGLTLATLLTLIPTAVLAHPGPAGHVHVFGQAVGGLDVLMAIAAAGMLVLAWRANRVTR